MKSKNKKTEKRLRIKKRIRAKIFGTAMIPRFSVFRSNNHIYAQLINDDLGQTLVSASDITESKGTNTERAQKIGETVAKAAIDKKISKVVFDRNGFRYTGRIKALADSARSGGLVF